MAERIETKAFVHQLALRMQTEDNVAAAWLEATVETLYDTFKAGKGVTLTGFGGFYVHRIGKCIFPIPKARIHQGEASRVRVPE
jgi:nucleoid DNA-binding protein